MQLNSGMFRGQSRILPGLKESIENYESLRGEDYDSFLSFYRGEYSRTALEFSNSRKKLCSEVIRPYGCFMTLRCSKLFNFSAQEFSTEKLTVASHSSALEKNAPTHSCSWNNENLNEEKETGERKDLTCSTSEAICLNVDPFLMGVGGDDSWSACVHEEFLLQPSEYSFKILMSFHYQ